MTVISLLARANKRQLCQVSQAQLGCGILKCVTSYFNEDWNSIGERELTDICKTINLYDLDAGMFRKALENVSNRQAIGLCSLEAKMVSCLEIVEGSPLPERKKSLAALAIHFRLEALANFLEGGGARGFRHKGLLGADMLDPAIVTCAALYPIVKKFDQITFEPTSSEQRLFATVKTVGSA